MPGIDVVATESAKEGRSAMRVLSSRGSGRWGAERPLGWREGAGGARRRSGWGAGGALWEGAERPYLAKRFLLKKSVSPWQA